MVREALGMPQGVERDPRTVQTADGSEILTEGEPLEGSVYMERVLVTGGGTLMVDRGENIYKRDRGRHGTRKYIIK